MKSDDKWAVCFLLLLYFLQGLPLGLASSMVFLLQEHGVRIRLEAFNPSGQIDANMHYLQSFLVIGSVWTVKKLSPKDMLRFRSKLKQTFFRYFYHFSKSPGRDFFFGFSAIFLKFEKEIQKFVKFQKKILT